MINYSDLNLHINNNTVIIDFNENQINVLQYLPIQDKIDLVYIALQKSYDKVAGMYNLLKVNMYLKLFTVYFYTDIMFTPEEKLDEEKLYDELTSTGLLDGVIAAIPEAEFDYVKHMADVVLQYKIEHDGTIASVIHSFVNELPEKAKDAKNIIENFDPAQFQQVLQFAQMANNGMGIN